MKTWKRFGATVATTSLLLMLVACDKPVKESFDAALSSSDDKMDDGSYYHPHVVKVPKGYEVSVTLRSDDFDTYVLAVPPDGSQQRENDDCDQEDASKGSCLKFVAHVGGEWKFVANSYGEGESGMYKMTVDAHKP